MSIKENTFNALLLLPYSLWSLSPKVTIRMGTWAELKIGVSSIKDIVTRLDICPPTCGIHTHIHITPLYTHTHLDLSGVRVLWKMSSGKNLLGGDVEGVGEGMYLCMIFLASDPCPQHWLYLRNGKFILDSYSVIKVRMAISRLVIEMQRKVYRGCKTLHMAKR